MKFFLKFLSIVVMISFSWAADTDDSESSSSDSTGRHRLRMQSDDVAAGYSPTNPRYGYNSKRFKLDDDDYPQPPTKEDLAQEVINLQGDVRALLDEISKKTQEIIDLKEKLTKIYSAAAFICSNTQPFAQENPEHQSPQAQWSPSVSDDAESLPKSPSIAQSAARDLAKNRSASQSSQISSPPITPGQRSTRNSLTQSTEDILSQNLRS